MNLNLKAVYYCTTALQTWGKGYTIKEAVKNAGLSSLTCKTDFVVYAALFNDPGEKEFENLFACITADPVFGGPQYYQGDRTKEDSDMIRKYHVGWIIILENIKNKSNEKDAKI